MARLTDAKMKKRDLMLLGLLSSNPQLTHEEASKASKDKYKIGIGFKSFRALKAQAMKGPPQEEGKSPIEKELKKGTTPLKTRIKQLGKELVESGFHGAVMEIGEDGKPHWHLDERRSVHVS